MFVPCINSIKTLFYYSKLMHTIANHRNIKTIKIPTVAPTCFGSRSNHLQGAVSCLAKTTNMNLCARRY